MNDDLQFDPALQSLEAQLIAHRPVLTDREYRELLYQCAFAAGRNSAIRRTRRWQVACASMVVLLLGTSTPLVHERQFVARPEPATNEHSTAVQVPTLRHVSTPWSRIAAVRLDAWQVQDNTDTKFAAELAKFKQLSANSRSLAVGTWMRPMAPMP